MPRPFVERRRSPRYLCSHLVEIRWLDSQGAAHAIPGLLEDVSREGAAIAVEQPIEAGTMVELITPGLQGRAEVRYCRPREQDFHLGLEFAGGCRWEPELWQPDHLFLPPLPR